MSGGNDIDERPKDVLLLPPVTTCPSPISLRIVNFYGFSRNFNFYYYHANVSYAVRVRGEGT